MVDSPPRVLLVIPCYNRQTELHELLTSLRQLRLNGVALSIVIVDDCSSSPIGPTLHGEFDDLDITVLRNNTNKGPAWSRNHGARAKPSDYVWFLDSDTEIASPTTLSSLIAALQSAEQQVGAAGGVMEEHQGERKILELTYQGNCTFLYRALPAGSNRSFVDGLSSANLFLRRDVFERAGGFCEGLRRDEDNDLCMTLRTLGYSCYQDSDTVVLNKITDSGRDSGAFAHFSDPRRYVGDLLDARLTLLVRHAPWRLPILWLLDVIFIPLIFIHKKRGTYVVNRFNKAIPRITPRLLVSFALMNLRSYCKGLLYFIARPARLQRAALD